MSVPRGTTGVPRRVLHLKSLVFLVCPSAPLLHYYMEKKNKRYLMLTILTYKFLIYGKRGWSTRGTGARTPTPP